MEGLESSMKVKEQPIEEIKRLRQEVAKLRQEKTERKRVEEKLHASEEQYRELFESAPESITLVGFDGTILNVNNASEIITGLPREEIIGKRFTELGVVHEKDLPKYTESLSQLASGESIQPYEVELTFKGGKTCWLEIFSGLLKKDNRPYAVQVITRDITERKKAEAARREGNARYNALFDRTLYCVYVHDFEGRFLDANDAALKLLGYTREELHSLNISSLLGEDQLPTALKTLEEIQQIGRQKGTTEFRLRTKDGNYVWVETEACLVYREGVPYAIQGIARDITERKKAQETLQESEEQYRNLFQTATDGIVTLDVTGRVTSCNKKTEEIFGYKQEELIGKHFTVLLPKKEAPRMSKGFQRVLEGKTTTYQTEIKTKSGDLVRVEVTTAALRRDAEVIGALEMVRDITERKQAEEELRRSEEKYRTILENTVEGYYEVDLAGNFTFVNDSICDTLGYSKNEIIGMNTRDYMDKQTAKKVLERFGEVYTTGQPARGFDSEVIRKDGTKLFISSSISLIRDARGEPIGFRGVARDITERKKAEAALRKGRESYNQLVNGITDIFFAFDKDLKYTHWNAASEKLTKISAEDAIGKSLYDLFPNTPQTRVAEKKYREVLRTGQPQIFVNEYKLGGKDYYFEISAYPLKDGISVFTKDITERKQAEKALQEAKTRFEDLFETANELIITTDAEGWILRLNKEVEKLSGYSKKELVGQSILNIAYPEDKDNYVQFWQDILSGLNPHYHLKGISKTGNVFDLLASGSAIRKDENVVEIQYNAKDITEEKQAEETLRRSEEKYRTILENTVEGYYEVDLAGNFTFFNDSLCKILGYSRNELLGMNNRDYMDKENARKLYQAFNKVYTTGKPTVGIDWETIRKDGTKRFIETSASVIRDARGEPTGFRGVVRDITEHKQAEEKLQASEERYRNLFENATDGIFTLDLKTRFTSGNKKAEEMCGYNKGELIGQYATIILPEEEIPLMTDAFKSVLKGEINTYETKIITKNGDLIPVEVTSSPIEVDGKIAGIMGMARDITERKQAEETLRRSEEKYRTILENITDGYEEVDLAGNFTFFNDSLCKILGYSKNEMIGMNYRQYMDKEDAHKVHQAFNKIYTTGKPTAGVDWELIRKDGTKIIIEGSSSLIRDARGEPIGFRGTLRDITERKQAEEKLQASEEKYRTILENITDGYYEVDLAGNFTFFNDSMCKMLGYPKNEMMGMNDRQYTDKENARKVYQAFNKVYTTRKPAVGFDWELTRKDGTKIIVEASASLIRDAQGEPIGFRGVVRDITERKQAEEVLRESEEKYRQLTEEINDTIYTLDKDGTVTYVSPVIEWLSGYSPSEIRGRSFAQFLHEEELLHVIEDHGQTLSGHSTEGEYRFRTKSGEIRWAGISNRPIFAGDRVVGARGTITDITKRKLAEQASEEARTRFEDLFETANELIITTDAEGWVLRLNKEVEKLSGYSKKELVGQSILTIAYPEDTPKYIQFWKDILSGLDPHYELRATSAKKDGGIRYLLASGSAIRKDGNIVEIQYNAKDITEEKQVEEKLRQSEEKYRTILENITDGYYEVDLVGNFTFFNDSYCRMLGYSKNEMMGMNDVQYTDKENARKVYQAFNKVYTTRKPAVGIDWEFIRKDGTKGFIEASASLIRDTRGKPIGFRGVARDITERKQMEAERNELEKKAQLATRLGVIGEMASGIVHEINNPLTSVIGFTEMLAQKELPEDAKEYVRIINSEGKRVASIASRLLNFSRHQNPGTEYTNINKLIEATLELQQYEMTSGNIKITTKLDPHLPRTMADPGQMQQVFLNILLNARTAMRLAHGGGKLLINTKAMDNTIQISFKDDGPGIAKKNLQRIFDPFFTTRKSGEGTGLGLSICQNIIATHDGTIYARSKLGKGATFIIKLPVVARQRKTAGNGGANHINGNPWR